MEPLRCAVIGTGYLGKFHAEKYAALPDCDLVAVVDTDRSTAAAVAERNSTRALSDFRQLLGEVDAVSIATPTVLHHEIARQFLNNGAHVLVEKPIATTVAEADELIELARTRGLALQVGHLERFNSVLLNLGDVLTQPLFIESHRLAPFRPRATDVDVVLDLMIHDIDLILSLVDSDIERIEASGAAVLTRETDIANARLVFENACVANVTASRISMKTERKMRVVQRDCYFSIDFQNRSATTLRRGQGEMFPGVPTIDRSEAVYASGDALLEEIRHFLHCARRGEEPLVNGEAGRRALETATRITRLLDKQGLSLRPAENT